MLLRARFSIRFRRFLTALSLSLWFQQQPATRYRCRTTPTTAPTPRRTFNTDNDQSPRPPCLLLRCVCITWEDRADSATVAGTRTIWDPSTPTARSALYLWVSDPLRACHLVPTTRQSVRYLLVRLVGWIPVVRVLLPLWNVYADYGFYSFRSLSVVAFCVSWRGIDNNRFFFSTINWLLAIK